MADPLSAHDFQERYPLSDWRVILGTAIETWLTAPTFAGAARFVADLGELADERDHHPDIDLRYPGRIHIRLSSHDAGGLTERDGALAAEISDLAAQAALVADPGQSMTVEVALDAMDIPAVRPFWKALLGYQDEKVGVMAELNAIVDPLGVGPPFWFQQMDEPRTERNRFHIDVTVPHDQAQARIDAALAAGGKLVTDRYARAFWVLADPEGNEACVCTWQDRT